MKIKAISIQKLIKILNLISPEVVQKTKLRDQKDKHTSQNHTIDRYALIYGVDTQTYLQELSKRYILIQKEYDIELLEHRYQQLMKKFKNKNKQDNHLEDLLIEVKTKLDNKKSSYERYKEYLNLQSKVW